MITEVVPALATAPKKKLSALIEREQRRKRVRTRVLASAVPALALLVALGWLLLRPKPVPIAARFRAQVVDRGDIVREVRATGRLDALTTVEVGAEISGRIASVEVDYNDRVRAGQVLARFDRAALEAQLAQIGAAHAAARATLEQAKTDRDRTAREGRRTEALFAARGVSEAERDIARATARLAQQRVSAAEAELLAQRAAYRLARTNLEHTIIYAPIDGVVITRAVDSGQTVAAMLQAPVLFTVAADLRKMHVIAAVDEADIGEVTEGQQAEFTVNAYPNRRFAGSVTKVRNSPEIVQDVVTYGTEVEVENVDLALKPGMTASVRIRTASAKNVVRVPAVALAFTPPDEEQRPAPAVWRLVGDALQRVPVTPGISDGELTQVATGSLEVGARVLIELTPEGRSAYGLGQ
jgi:HlyD family secretion protein